MNIIPEYSSIRRRRYTDILYPEKDAQPIAEEHGRLARVNGSIRVPEKEEKNNNLGVRLSHKERQDYRMTLKLDEVAKNFFGREEFVSREIYAHNSATNPGKGVTSSFNRRADRVTMMRKVEGDDRSSDYYTGRVDTAEKGIEQSKFLFLSELELYDHDKNLAKGISKSTDGEADYEFTFAVQSLLSTALVKDDYLKFDAERETYNYLRDRVIRIPNPHGGEPLRVRIRPLPIAATQFNWMNKLELVLDKRSSGSLKAKETSRETDRALFELAQGNEKALETYDLLVRERDSKTGASWKEVLYRAYLCHLVGIPLVIHCKSSVDRTGLAGAMVTAMKQWIASGKEIPDDIAEIVDYEVEGVKPFKELFSHALEKSLHNTEISRENPGYKYNTKVKILGIKWDLGFTSPSLLALLPERYLVKKDPVWRQTKMFLIRVSMVALFAIAFMISLPLMLAGVFMRKPSTWIAKVIGFTRIPLRIIKNAGLLIAKKGINDTYQKNRRIRGKVKPLFIT